MSSHALCFLPASWSLPTLPGLEQKRVGGFVGSSIEIQSVSVMRRQKKAQRLFLALLPLVPQRSHTLSPLMVFSNLLMRASSTLEHWISLADLSIVPEHTTSSAIAQT